MTPLLLLKMLHCKRMMKKKNACRVRDETPGSSHSRPSQKVLLIKKEKIEYEGHNICRVCLKEGSIPIFGDDEIDDSSEALTTFAGINVSSDDEYPKYLCQACNMLLQGAVLFRKTAQQTDEALRHPPYTSTEDEPDLLGTDTISFDYELNVEIEEVKDLDNVEYKQETEQKQTTYQCKRCSLDFNTFAEYNDHRISDEHENMRATCPICKNTYAPVYLKKHMALHKQEPLFMCDICGKKFIIQGQFKRHRLTHFFNLPFQCSLCPYKGRFSESLKMHMRTHTGEKPYQCPQCPSRFFVNKSNLNKHLLVHKGDHDFKCGQCQRGFYSKRELDAHYKVDHGGIKEHVCNVCRKAFGYRKQMMKHQRKVHKREKLRSGRTPLYILAETKKNNNES